MMRNGWAWLGWVFIGCPVLLGCQSGSGGVRPAPGVSVLAPGDAGDAEAVALMTQEPGRSFRVVGLVRAAGEARFEGQIPEARASAERTLRRQGASVGADAVIIDESGVAEVEGGAVNLGTFGSEESNLQRPGGAAYATRPVHRVTLRGRAIVFTE